MASRIAEAYVQIVPRIDGIGSSLTKGLSGEMGKAGEQSGQGFGAGFKKMLGPLIAAFSVAAVANFTKDLINAGEKSATSNARIQQIAKSMGIFGTETATVTGRLVKLAEEQARLTGIDQNSIKATQAKLLTFKELAASAGEVGGAFDRATKAAIDLEAAGFGSAEQQAVALGKALNDPTKGMTALARAGITFNDVEKEKIKTMQASGDLLGAQEVLLQAVETQVSGTAEATANSSDKMNVAFSLLKEELATGLMPAFDGAVEAIIPLIQEIGPHLSAAISATVNTFKVIFGFIKDNLPVIATFVGIISAAALAINAVRIATAIWATVQTLMNLVLSANPLGLVIVAVAALAAGIVWVATKTTFFQDIWEAMTKAVSKAWDAVVKFFDTTFKSINKWFTDLWSGATKVWNTFTKVIGGGVKAIGDFFRPMLDGVSNLFKGAINSWLGLVERFLNFFINGINGVVGGLNLVLEGISAATGGLINLRVGNIPSVRLPRLAKGGYVDQATTAIIGEAGPEVVTPLKDFERMMGLDGKSGKTINYYAAPNNSVDSEQALLQAIKRAKVITGW